MPVYDPSKNVDTLVAAAIQRQDDLRSMESAHIRELLAMDREHSRELRQAEAERIDAIRAVDVGAVQRAAEVQAAQQQALAAQVATTADAFRVSLAAALAPITTSVDDLRTKDIADLRRAQYEAQGQKTQVVESSTGTRDELLAEQGRMQAAMARMQLWGVIIAAVILAIGLYTALHRP